MQAQLFISGLVAVLSLAPCAIASGADSPDQVPHPQFSVVAEKDHNVLRFHGSTAETVFNHLNDPEVRRFSSDFFQIKIGFGVICAAQVPTHSHSCWQRLTDDGEVQNNFPYVEKLKQSASWLRLILKGPSMEQLYNKMSEDGEIYPNPDGSMSLMKQRTALTCIKHLSAEGAPFDCRQDLSAGGLSQGPGTDPMIGSGTHPVMLEVEEGVN